jgi:hypothetical protein
MTKLKSALALLFVGLLILAGCDSAGTNDDGPPERTTVWSQSFDTNTDGWITDKTSGASGWCGDMSHFNSDAGPVSASSGEGYATVAHGTCNEYWTNNGFPNGSGPFGPFDEYSEEWPSGGFVGALDIYLNPNWSAGSDGTVFTYSTAIRLLNKEYPDNFRYFFVPVTKANGALQVLGNEVSEAGWYTVRHVFTDDEGSLAVKFQLMKNGEVLFNTSVAQTALSEEDVSSFDTENVGTGYAWFVAIASDLDVPIDRHRLLQ